MDSYRSYKSAAAQLGWSSPGLRSWVRRYNKRHPESPIRRMFGRVHLLDLENAIRAETEKYTFGETGTTDPSKAPSKKGGD